jgi:hypothetical protein
MEGRQFPRCSSDKKCQKKAQEGCFYPENGGLLTVEEHGKVETNKQGLVVLDEFGLTGSCLYITLQSLAVARYPLNSCKRSQASLCLDHEIYTLIMIPHASQSSDGFVVKYLLSIDRLYSVSKPSIDGL